MNLVACTPPFSETKGGFEEAKATSAFYEVVNPTRLTATVVLLGGEGEHSPPRKGGLGGVKKISYNDTHVCLSHMYI